jgi:hypothetical protein
VLARVGPFTVTGTCLNEGSFEEGVLSISTSEQHSTYDTDIAEQGSADMYRDNPYALTGNYVPPEQLGFSSSRGMAVTPSGFTVAFDVYAAINALGSECQYGGTFFVVSPQTR